MKYYIGADLGTSALKLLLTDADGNILSSVTNSYEVRYPRAGWSEQSPADWWSALVLGIKQLTKDIDKDKVAGLAVAGQMHGLVALDKNDAVIRPAILWNDGRTDKETEYLNTVIGKQRLSELTANIAFAGFTAPKILWMRSNEKDNFDRIAKIMLPKDYINYRLTGAHATDFSDASGMLLLDVKNKRWSPEMLEVCGISEEQLPALYESYQTIGTLLPEAARELGLNDNVKVAAGAGDNAAAAIGTDTVSKGKCNVSLGTSGTIFISSDGFAVDDNNALHAFCHSNGKYHLMGCILSAASCNKWFCGEILHTGDYSGEEKKITEDMLGNNGVFFLPYLMGERSPINDTDAVGTFVGLRPDTKRENMLLAVFEGVAFAIRDNLEIAKSLGIKIERSTVCGGGAKSKIWRTILSNVLNVKLDVPLVEEGPGLGSAMLAMVACGEYESTEQCADKLFKIKETVVPDEAIVKRYEERYEKFSKIYPALKPVFKAIK